MPATLAQLLRRPDLDLEVHAGEDALDAAVRWVAVSELEDPTPYLQGGELLLTTGMLLPRSRAGVDAYVRRLIDVGVVGLGFGVKVVRAKVPVALARAAAAQGLPLIEVGKPTPFIAISKAVGDLIAAEQVAELSAGLEAQQQITRAAVLSGASGVVTRLAAAIDGWVVLLDAHGDVLQAAPRGAASDPGLWTDELRRLDRGGPAAAARADSTATRVVQPLGTGGRVTGYLVTGQPAGTPAIRHRATINVAAALLSFASAQDGGGEQGRAARAALVGLVAEHFDAVSGRAVALGGPLFEADNLWVLKARGDSQLLERLHSRLEDEGPAHCLPWATEKGLGVLVASAAERDRVLYLAPDKLAVGVSAAHPPRQLRSALEEGDQAAAAAASAGVRVRRYEDVVAAGVLGLVDPERAQAVADALLAPLTEYERGSGVPLCESLRHWLAHHGQFDPAATELGVHRHTLRYRIRKAAELLDSDLEDAAVRMELWFALTVQSGQQSVEQ